MIELSHITKTFGNGASQVHAVQDVSITVQDGEIYGIIGFSGAGKSTLVRCVNLLERPTSGSVTIDGQDMLALAPAQLRRTRKKIGMIFQHFNLMPSRTVYGNVAYPLRGSGLSKQQISDKVRQLLTLVELSEKENAYPSQLSGGQKQRVAIARALANDPKILLCDEATSALDPQTTNSILHLLQRLNEQLNLTIVVITHEMAVVKEICDQVAVMDHGRVIEEGDVFTIFSSPQEPVTRDFIRTTSNLNKIEQLIEENAPITQLHPGELIARLTYIQNSVSEPLISRISRDFKVDVNIIFSNVEQVKGGSIGGTVAVMSGERQALTNAIAYLSNRNVSVEVIKDARVS